MLSPEVLKQIKTLELRAGHLVTDALAGNYLSAFKGRGMEFDEVREYVPGDDVRTIDWNVTARMNAPFVKVLREERELTLMLMVDVSPSQSFGTVARAKREVAAELAAVLAFLATRNNDKVGLICFSDHVEQFIPPKKGRGHVWSIIRSVLTHEGKGRRTDVAATLDFLGRVTSRRAMSFLISDFWASGYEQAMRLAARRHDLVAVRVRDPRELSMPRAGVVSFQDLESGELVTLDMGNRKVRERYAALMEEEERRLTGFFRRCGIGAITVRTGEPVVAPLVRYLRERERKKR
jgi:uncharacterized protein (DUF58 family)